MDKGSTQKFHRELIMEPAVLSLKRRVSVDTDFTKCIICQQRSDDDLHNLTNKVYDTFFNAAKVRQDDVYERLSSCIHDKDSFIGKGPKCHRSCRSRYTHKRDLELVAKPQKRSKQEETAIKPMQKEGRVNIDYKSCCFICEKARDKKGERNLILVATDQRQRSIYCKALELQDDKMLLKIQGLGNKPLDMVAADIRYHKSCLDKFMNRRNVFPVAATTRFDVYDSAFRTLVSEISNKLLNERAVYYTSQLCNGYRSILDDSGVAHENQYQTKNLNKRLQDHFGSQIQIVFQRGKSSIVCASTITVGEMCAFAAKLRDTDADSESSDQDTVSTPIIHSDTDSHAIAKHLHMGMKEHAKQERLTRRSGETDQKTISYESASKHVPDDLRC